MSPFDTTADLARFYGETTVWLEKCDMEGCIVQINSDSETGYCADCLPNAPLYCICGEKIGDGYDTKHCCADPDNWSLL